MQSVPIGQQAGWDTAARVWWGMYEEHDTEGSRTEISWFSPHGLVTTPTELLHSTFHSANLQCHGWPSVTLAQDGNALHKVPN